MEGPDVHSSNTVIGNGAFGTYTIRFETGLLARQANESMPVYLDDNTTVFATITTSKALKKYFDFFPLMVDVEERSYAVGCIPGSFFRHGGHPGTETVLAVQFIGRPLRPAFKKGMRNRVQVVATVMTTNPDKAYGVPAINAASMATSLAGPPFSGPIGGICMALIDRQWVAFPRWGEFKRATFPIAIAGRVAGDDVAVVMAEARAPEHADTVVKAGGAKPVEAEVAAGVEAVKSVIRTLYKAQSKLVGECGKSVDNFPFFPGYADEQYEIIEEKIGGHFAPILGAVTKAEHDGVLNELIRSVVEEFAETFPEEGTVIATAVNAAFKKTMCHRVLMEGVHMDGRTPVGIRTTTAEAGVLPRVRGSALFQHGETQILGVTTFNMLKMKQQLSNLSPATSQRYVHRYSFPPYLTGETGRVGPPRRRKIGRGRLAEIALESQLPGREEFPYVIRRISETIGSDSSSLMGSVCASTLSFHNAGVPLKASVAGIAMGLISATIDGGTKYCILTDILGAEGALGDMDFKVAGTYEYVTALQLDTKLNGIPAVVLDTVLGQACDARFAILDLIIEAIDGPDEMVVTMSRIITVKIPVDKIGEVTGPKDKMINQIQENTGAEISIGDDSTVFIGATNGPSAEAARQVVDAIANPQVPEVGERFVGIVVKTTTFGAFILLALGRDGLPRIPQIRRIVDGKRVGNVEDVLNVDDKIKVEIAEIDPRGEVSLYTVVEEGSEAPAEQEEAEHPARREHGLRRAPHQHRRPSESSGLTE